MMRIEYFWSKFFKKIRGSAIIKSQIHKTSKVESGCHVVNTVMSKHSFCGYDCVIVNCEIGSFCSIANNVKIGGGMHPINWASTSPVFYEGKDSVKAKFSEYSRTPTLNTVIEHDVWIGEGAIIKQGVYVGTGAVVGMGSIVTKDVPPYSIVGGNPAKLIKKRFDDNLVEKLLSSKWWELDEEELKFHAKYITNPLEFIESIENLKNENRNG